MVMVWAIFSIVLFIAEPLVLHAWFRSRAVEDPDGTFAIIQRAHWLLLILSVLAIGGAALGAHGVFF